MPVRLLSGPDVESLLSMSACIDIMADALSALARGEGNLPLRTILRLTGRGALGLMPAELGAIGVKAITVFPGNAGTPFDSHQGVVLLFDPDHGTVAGIIDASSVTAIRTAAVSGVATRLLAREDAATLALLGSGVQARTHLEAICAVRPITRVSVWSPRAKRREAFAAWARTRSGLTVEPCDSAQQAVAEADVICTVTSAKTPVLHDDWIAPGAHINAVGASLPEARELDSALVAGARLFVDRRESAVHEAGDFLIPLREGAITEHHILGELGDLLLERVQGRNTTSDVTLFKSLGLAIEDVAACAWLLRTAEREGIGTVVELGGRRGEE